MGSEIIVVIVVATALTFDFTNGFHDTANVVATSISTRAMAPRIAVGYAAILNFVGAFISLQVAATVAQDVVDGSSISLLAVFAGLVGAIAWNLITWYFGLPSSSSHALIGGIVGAVLVADGPSAIYFEEGILGKVMIPALVAPSSRSRSAAWPSWSSTGSWAPAPRAGDHRLPLRPGDLRRAARSRARHQRRPEDDGRDHARAGGQWHHRGRRLHMPTWVVVSAATAIALGTYAGGWRIIKTMGSRIHKMDSAQGFAAQGAGAAVILAASKVGFPLHHPHHLGRGDRLGRGQAAVRGALGWPATS